MYLRTANIISTQSILRIKAKAPNSALKSFLYPLNLIFFVCNEDAFTLLFGFWVKKIKSNILLVLFFFCINAINKVLSVA